MGDSVQLDAVGGSNLTISWARNHGCSTWAAAA